MSAALREDALTSTPDGFELRIGLPWIRSMPLSAVSDVAVSMDGHLAPAEGLRVRLSGREVRVEDLVHETERWWYLQDRLVLTGPLPVGAGRHHVTVDFRLLVPYLTAGPGVPVVLPYHLDAILDTEHHAAPGVARDVA